MLISLSLSKPSQKRRSDPVGKKMPRMGSEKFLQMSKAKQKKYLELYPASKNRFLLKKKLKKKTELAPSNKAFTRRIGRAAYDKLDKSQQKAYDKLYKGDRKFSGRKHIAVKRINPILQKKRDDAKNRIPEPKRLTKLRAAEEQAIAASRARAHQDFKGSVNPEAVKAAQEVTEDDLKECSVNLRRDKQKILEGFDDKLENDRLDALEISPQDKRDLQSKIESGEIPEEEHDEVGKIIRSETHTRDQKKKVESILNPPDDEEEAPAEPSGKKKKKKKKINEVDDDEVVPPEPRKNFFQRDMEAMGKILRGEKVQPEGKNNFIIGMSIMARYAMIAGGVALVSMGAGPLAIHIAREIYDNWQNLSLSSEDDGDDYDVDKAYDAVVDYMHHMDVTKLHESVGKTKFKSESTGENRASRISYRSVAEEKELPIHNRTRWTVMLGKRPVGEIFSDTDNDSRQTVRVWKAYVTEGFSPLEFPHLDEVSKDINEPFILTNDDAAIDHNLELHTPTLMTLAEARAWVCSIIERNK